MNFYIYWDWNYMNLIFLYRFLKRRRFCWICRQLCTMFSNLCKKAIFVFSKFRHFGFDLISDDSVFLPLAPIANNNYKGLTYDKTLSLHHSTSPQVQNRVSVLWRKEECPGTVWMFTSTPFLMPMGDICFGDGAWCDVSPSLYEEIGSRDKILLKTNEWEGQRSDSTRWQFGNCCLCASVPTTPCESWFAPGPHSVPATFCTWACRVEDAFERSSQGYVEIGLQFSLKRTT